MNWNETLGLCEQWIREGQPEMAAKKILGLAGLNPPMEFRARLATIAGDAGLSSLGLRLIADELPNSNFELPLRNARLLAQAGALRDALDLLAKLPDQYEVRLARAEALHEAGRDVDADSEAKAALHLNFQSTEAHLIAAAALLRLGKTFEARTHIVSAYVRAKTEDNKAAVTRARVLRIELGILESDFTDTKTQLEHLANAVGDSNPFLLKKWRTLLLAASTKSLQLIDDLKQECIAQKDFEGLRLCDLLALRLRFDRDRFDRLYFGTPSLDFRKRLEREFQIHPDAKEMLFGSAGAPLLDLVTGTIEGGDLNDLPPRLIHSIIVALTRDLYRPVSAGAIFSEVFPGEVFDVKTSVHRVHQAIHRTRRWLGAHQIAISIDEFKGRYTLTVDGIFAIRIPLEQQTSDNEFRRLYALTKVFGDRGFTARQARQALGLSPAVFKSLMLWGQETGQVTRLGAGPSTKYKINAA